MTTEVFKRKARGTEILRNSPRVFLSYQAPDRDKRDEIMKDILSQDAGIDCTITYLENPEEEINEAQIKNEMLESQLLVACVTDEFLRTIEVSDFPIEYRIARDNQIPILPLVERGDLLQTFSDKAGLIHGLNLEDLEYRKKLKDQLEKLLISHELANLINEKAFAANLFLSYRKMDIETARKFMKDFHNIEGLQSVSIWYDNFLTAGRNFDDEIKSSIDKCDAFTLLVTPNLATEGNFVQTTEYPYAQGHEKKVIPVEAVNTDINSFSQLYSGARVPIKLENTSELHEIFFKSIPRLEREVIRTNEQKYYLGIAYLKGQGLERDTNRAISLLELYRNPAFLSIYASRRC